MKHMFYHELYGLYSVLGATCDKNMCVTSLSILMKVLSHPGHGNSVVVCVGNQTCFSFSKMFHLCSQRFMKHLQETETHPVAYDISLRIIFHHTIYWNHPHWEAKVAFRL